MGRRGDTLTTQDGLGISIPDVSGLLGLGAHDLKSPILSSRVNPWAKFKPVVCNNPVIRHGETFGQTVPFVQGLVQTPLAVGLIGSGQGGGAADDYVTTYNYFGLKVPFQFGATVRQTLDAIDNYPTNGKNWPAAGMASAPWARLLDFDGYNHRAYCPLWLSARAVVYAGQQQYFQGEWTDNESMAAVGMDGINDMVPSGQKFLLRIAIRKYGETQPASIIESETELGDQNGFYEIFEGSLSAGTYQAYLYAESAQLNARILLPSTDDFPNPYAFIVRDTLDPESNPWNRLEVGLDDWSFGWGLSLNRQHWAGYCMDTAEGRYIELWSSGRYVLYVDVVNSGNTAVNLVRADIHFEFANCGASGNGRPAYQTYLSVERGAFVLQTGSTISVPASSRGIIAFVFEDIFYDGSTRYPVQEGAYYGNPDTMDLYYDGAVQFNLETQIKYTTDPAQNGKAYSHTTGLSWNAHD